MISNPHRVDAVLERVTQRTQETIKLKQIYIQDSNGKVKVSMWRQLAETSIEVGKTVKITFLKLNINNGEISLQTIPQSTLEYVKLVESASFTVKSEVLRNITNKAKREKNPGYFLVIKLMPMVFRTEEMANSRGQGLRPAKTGDIRLPLDVDKIKTVK
ncbi:Hypothetical predicted protein, partial [Mytilus galloprovincialis]